MHSGQILIYAVDLSICWHPATNDVGECQTETMIKNMA